MADWYVRSGATGTGAGTSWGNAAVSSSALMALGTKPVAGDNVFFAHDHAANYSASTTITWPTGPAPVKCYSVDDNANYASTSHSAPGSSTLTAKPSTSTSYAIETTTGPAINITHNGFVYMHGITIKPVGLIYFGSANTTHKQTFVKCLFWCARTSSGAVTFGNGGAVAQDMELHDTDINFTAATTTGGITLTSGFKMFGGAVTGTMGTTLIIITEIHNPVLLDGVDLSVLGSGKYLVDATYQGDVTLTGCLLGSSVTLANTATRVPTLDIKLVGCDVTGGSVQRHEQATYLANIARDSGVYRTGSDGDQSLVFRSLAAASTASPARILIGRYGFDDTADKTITAYVAQKSGKTRATNSELWIEAAVPASASPRHTILSSGVASSLHTGTSLTTDSGSSWTGLTTPVLSTITLSLTTSAYQAGAVDIYLCGGKDFSGTDDEIYVDIAVS